VSDTKSPVRCVFCRMRTTHRFAKLPMCEICRDQSYDFLWASLVQAAAALATTRSRPEARAPRPRSKPSGRYRVLCTIPGHVEAGMVGELVVHP
jgi:hypothetical protein